MLTSLLKRYMAALQSHPVATNMASGVCLAAVGDATCQALENDHPYLPTRTLELAATRIIITPLLVRWYGVLNARFPGTAMKMVVRRMAADQLIWAPIFMSVFFPVVNMTRGMSPKEALAETSQRIVPALKANYCIWPLFHLVNFRFVPVRMQVLATTAMSMVWNGVLSHVARPGQEHDDKG